MILSSTSDLTAALNAILSAACRIPGVDSGGVYLVDEHRDLYLAAHARLSPEFVAAVQHYPHGSPEAQLAEQGRSIYADRGRLPPGTNDALAAEGLRSVAIVPVKHEGRLVALLNVASRTRDELPVSTRHTLETLASRLGGVIVRLRTRQELVASRDNLQSLFDAIDDFLFILDGEGRILHVNPVVETAWAMRLRNSAAGRSQRSTRPSGATKRPGSSPRCWPATRSRVRFP